MRRLILPTLALIGFAGCAQAQVVTASGKGDLSQATSGEFCTKRVIGGVTVAIDLVHKPPVQADALRGTIDAKTLAGAPMNINTFPNSEGSTLTVTCNGGPELLPGVDFVN